MLRTAVFALLVGTVVAAQASFEMMLLPGADGRIYRYDPVNNINLGSYKTYSSTSMVTADLDGIAYSSGSGSSAFYGHSYSTGLATGAITGLTNSIASHVVNGSLYVMTNTEIRKYSTTTGALQGTYGAGGATTFRAMTSFANRMIVLGYTSGGSLTSQSFDMTTFASSATITYGVTATLGTNMGRAASIRNSLTNTNLAAFTYVNSVGGLTLLRIPLNNDGTIQSASFNTSSPVQYNLSNFIPSVLAGHNSVYLYGQDSTTATDARLLQYEMTTGLVLNSSVNFATPGGFRAGAHSYQAAILVAPEPGTMIGLGLGLAAILKRRRARA